MARSKVPKERLCFHVVETFDKNRRSRDVIKRLKYATTQTYDF